MDTQLTRLGIEGFEPFRGRDLRGGHNVKVYRNLNEEQATGRVRWSIGDLATGLVVGHADKLAVEHARVHVNRAAQARIAAGGNRTVHAWVTGTLTWCPTDGSPWYGRAKRVTYQPRRSNRFYFYGYGDWFTGAPLVRFDEYGMWAWR
jgi:hypothetical protein